MSKSNCRILACSVVTVELFLLHTDSLNIIQSLVFLSSVSFMLNITELQQLQFLLANFIKMQLNF